MPDLLGSIGRQERASPMAERQERPRCCHRADFLIRCLTGAPAVQSPLASGWTPLAQHCIRSRSASALKYLASSPVPSARHRVSAAHLQGASLLRRERILFEPMSR